MVKNIKLIKCFIASPSDVADERSHVKKIIETLNPVFMERGLRVEPIMWENNAIPAIGGDAQEIINAHALTQSHSARSPPSPHPPRSRRSR